MYSAMDLSVIYNSYFTLIELKPKEFTIKSNNTGHTWRIFESKDGFYGIYHKHSDNEAFHFHFACACLQECFLEITSHDMYQLCGRKNTRNKIRTFYDDILEMYIK